MVAQVELDSTVRPSTKQSTVGSVGLLVRFLVLAANDHRLILVWEVNTVTKRKRNNIISKLRNSNGVWIITYCRRLPCFTGLQFTGGWRGKLDANVATRPRRLQLTDGYRRRET
nr:hypothetical protein Itr_chr05CG15380 [Ipomoea trifida]